MATSPLSHIVVRVPSREQDFNLHGYHKVYAVVTPAKLGMVMKPA
jgi:hypothetical protein